MPTKLKSTGVEFPDNTTQTSAAVSYTDSDALDLFNATGSPPVYACRAWVNFNGTGTVSIRDSGNVSSITDLATGRFGINFSTNMPDDNSSVVGLTGRSGGLGERFMSLTDIFSGSVRVDTRNAAGTYHDNNLNCVAVFR